MTNSIEAVRAFEAHQEQLKTLARRIFDIAQPMEGKSPFGNLVNVGDRLLELAANTDLSQVLKDLEELEAHRKAFRQASTNGSMTQGGENLYRLTIERAQRKATQGAQP